MIRIALQALLVTTGPGGRPGITGLRGYDTCAPKLAEARVSDVSHAGIREASLHGLSLGPKEVPCFDSTLA